MSQPVSLREQVAALEAKIRERGGPGGCIYVFAEEVETLLALAWGQVAEEERKAGFAEALGNFQAGLAAKH